MRDLSMTLNNVAAVERELGDPDAARAAYQESLDLRRQLCAAFPEHPQFQHDLAALIAAWEGFDPAEPGSAVP
jgi:hypothetical protein